MSKVINDRRTLLIGGEWRQPRSNAVIEVENPATEEVIACVAAAGQEDVDEAAAAAADAFEDGRWRNRSLEERAAVLRDAAELLAERRDEAARVLTAENGTPSTMARQLGPVNEGILTYFASLADTYPFSESVTGLHQTAVLTREPVGVVAAITPWNGPLYLAAQKLAPALLAGCSVLLKLPPEAPLSGLLLAECLVVAGVPSGVLSVLVGDAEVGRAMVNDGRVHKVSFTGSSTVGLEILAAAAKDVKRTTLELGGKSAGIILDDVDLKVALPYITAGMTTMSGQSCGLLSRLLIPRRRRDEVLDALVEVLRAQRVGDPLDETTTMGPLISARHLARVEGYVDAAKQDAVRIATGGRRPPHLDRGHYLEPTLIIDVDNRSRIAQEEIFGPVICAIDYDTDEEAVHLANDTPFGLGAAVFGSDVDRARSIGRRLRAGTVAINCYGTDAAIPQGGYGLSGLGRERGVAGLDEYVELKSTYGPPGAPA